MLESDVVKSEEAGTELQSESESSLQEELTAVG
jgi:hypothetical protein